MPTPITILLLVASVSWVTLASESNSLSVVPTLNWINTVSGYSDLSSCAINVLSTIVRDESSGCGDGGATTSYTCFCTDSSSHFSSVITSAISHSCATSIWSAQASSAIQVFDSYCDLGVEAGLATTTADSSSSSKTTATPIATPSTTTPSATFTTTASPSSSINSASVSVSSPTASSTISATASPISNSKTSTDSKSVAIAVGVAVPLSALIVLGGLLWRRRRIAAKNTRIENHHRLEKLDQAKSTSLQDPLHHWNAHYPTELRHELPHEPTPAIINYGRHELYDSQVPTRVELG